MKSVFLFLLAALFPIVAYVQTTNISGTINRYQPVTDVIAGNCSDTIVLRNQMVLQPGDRIMIIQMQGATIQLGNNASYGDVVSLGNAGNYEWAEVELQVGTSVIIKGHLNLVYDTIGNVQLLDVPTYVNANVTGNLTAPAWNGETGGIIALEVQGTLSLLADIIADGVGFRGGISFFATYPFNSSTCGNTDYFNPLGNSNGGEKGQGIHIPTANHVLGKGHQANAGGGGNSHNSGGAGGGNIGIGGIGGFEYNGCPAPLVTGGIGGGGLTYSNADNKVYMGGGGGGGDANATGGTNGQNGGGIIIIKANTVQGNSRTISANGGDNATNATFDAAGGGGGGGSVLLDVATFSGNLTVEVNGGKGGDNNNAGSCVGTGGGGGGGIVWHNGATLPVNVTSQVNGGASGMFINSAQASCFNTTYGATAGTAGGLLANLVLPILDPPPPNVVDLGNDTILCPGDSLILDVTTAGATYLWQDNSTNPTFTVTQPGTFSVTVTTPGCISSDEIDVTYVDFSLLNLGPDTTLCQGETKLLDASITGATYLWQDNSTNPTFNVTQSGVYSVDVTVNNCSESDSITIDYNQPPTIELGNDTILCEGESLLLDATSPGATYLWQDNSINSSFLVNQPGTYSVAISIPGCTSFDQITVSYADFSALDLGPDTAFCEGTSIILDPGISGVSYLWQDNSTNPTFTVTQGGLYFVEVRNGNCSKRDSVTITIDEQPEVELGEARGVCEGDTVTYNLSAPNTIYSWGHGPTSGNVKIWEPGKYWVDARSGECLASDTVFISSMFPPVPRFPNDTLLCDDIELVLFSNDSNSTFLWYNGNTGSFAVINEPGEYWLNITNACGSITDSISADFYDCDCYFYLPNAFSPNGDFINDVFRPKHNCVFEEYSLTIFNRWGEIVFESEDPLDGWDGTMNSNVQPVAPFAYKIRYQFVGWRLVEETGNLTIIK